MNVDVSGGFMPLHESVVQELLNTFTNQAVDFTDFIELPRLSDGTIELVNFSNKPANIELNLAPLYGFKIVRNGETIGECNVRIGYTKEQFFCGNLGYEIFEPFRGHHYAVRACRLLIPVMQAHGMKKANITTAVDNRASVRTCELLGARYLGIAALPPDVFMFRMGRRFSHIYQWQWEE